MTAPVRALLAVAFVLTGCGGGNGTEPPADGGATDGDTDGGGFDPDETYPGEGTACEFSLFCNERQICVDGECIRHERVSADELELGEFRNLYGEELQASPLYTEADFDWDGQNVSAGEVRSFIFPGPDGPETIFFPDYEEKCQVAVYGHRLRIVSIADMFCNAAGLGPDGHLILGGLGRSQGRGRIVLFDATDAKLHDIDLTAILRDRLAREFDFGEVGGLPTSFTWDGDTFVVSASVGEVTDPTAPGNWGPTLTQPYSEQTVFARITLDGDVELLTIGDKRVHEGARGWLLRDESGIQAVMFDYWDDFLDTRSGIARTELLSLSDGSRSLLGMSPSVDGRFWQPFPDTWYYVATDHPELCDQTIFSPAGEELSTVWSRGAMSMRCGFGESTRGHGNGAIGITGAVVSGHPGVFATSMEPVVASTEPETTYDYELYFEGTDRVEPMRDPARFIMCGTNTHNVAARFGKTYEVFGGYYAEDTALTWWETTLRRKEIGR